MSGKKAVYFINVNCDFGYVSYLVWDCLQEEGFLQKETDMIFDGNPVMAYEDQAGNTFYFAPTQTAICLDYNKYLPDMNKYFADCDVSGMVTLHGMKGSMHRKKC